MPSGIHPASQMYPGRHRLRRLRLGRLACQELRPWTPERVMTGAPKPHRHRIVAVRMSDAEHADASACAAALGISLARLLRSRAAAIPPSRTDLTTARELTRIGNNLNQLVRQVHGGFRPTWSRSCSNCVNRSRNSRSPWGGAHDREHDPGRRRQGCVELRVRARQAGRGWPGRIGRRDDGRLGCTFPGPRIRGAANPAT